MTHTIVTLTMNPAVDKSTTVERVIPEHKLRCKQPTFEPGGGGINVSRAIMKLGGKSLAMYPSGGLTGKRLQDLLSDEQLAHHPITVTGDTRENLIVYEETSTQQFRFGMPGANLTETDWRSCLTSIRQLDPTPSYVVGSGSLPPGVPVDFYVELIDMANEVGAHAIIDTSGEALHAVFNGQRGAYLLKPNVRELEQLVGHDLKTEQDQIDAARNVINNGACDVVVVSLGAAGALLITEDDHTFIRAPYVPIQSKVGAGDSMVAGIVLSLTRGMSLLESAQFGVASGAAAVMTPGTQLCRREDAERLYDTISNNRY